MKSWYRTVNRLVPRLAAVVLAAALAPPVAAASDVAAAAQSPASADPAAEPAAGPFAADRQALEARLQALESYAADFTQTVYGVRGEVLEQSQGRVRLQRPNFRWEVDDPYPQVLLASGDELQLYDPDLEQLTVRPLDEALTDTPVALLTRDAVALTEDFQVMRLSDPEGEAFVIEPSADETLYREIVLHFQDQALTGLDILDHLGQRTEIRFRPDPDAHMDAATFALEIPPGTDVVGG